MRSKHLESAVRAPTGRMSAQGVVTPTTHAGVRMSAHVRQDFPTPLAFLALCLGKCHQHARHIVQRERALTRIRDRDRLGDADVVKVNCVQHGLGGRIDVHARGGL